MVYRLVGSYEYSKALELLEQLVNQSTAEEIEVYNLVIKTRPEFDVFTLPKLYKKANDNSDAGAYHVKHSGIEWIMALARLEMAGILATYSDVNDPFAQVNPTLLERNALNQLVLSDTAAHLRALFTDPAYKTMLAKSSKNIDSQAFAYLRRFKLVTHLLAYSTAYIRGNKKKGLAGAFDNWSRELRGNFQLLSALITKDLSEVQGTASFVSGTSKNVSTHTNVIRQVIGRCYCNPDFNVIGR